MFISPVSAAGVHNTLSTNDHQILMRRRYYRNNIQTGTIISHNPIIATACSWMGS